MADSFSGRGFAGREVGPFLIRAGSLKTARELQIVSRGRAHGNGFLNAIPWGCQLSAGIGRESVSDYRVCQACGLLPRAPSLGHSAAIGHG